MVKIRNLNDTLAAGRGPQEFTVGVNNTTLTGNEPQLSVGNNRELITYSQLGLFLTGDFYNPSLLSVNGKRILILYK